MPSYIMQKNCWWKNNKTHTLFLLATTTNIIEGRKNETLSPYAYNMVESINMVAGLYGVGCEFCSIKTCLCAACY